MLANAFGADWAYSTPEDVMREIAEIAPAYKGISYGKLDNAGIQWPCGGDGCQGTPILFAQAFPKGKALFAPVEAGVGAARPEDSFLLLTGTTREHHATGVRTRRAPSITKLVSEARLQMNPADAKAIGVGEGDIVKVSTDTAAVEVAVCVTARIPTGLVFLPGFSQAAPASRLLKPEDNAAVVVKVERTS